MDQLTSLATSTSLIMYGLPIGIVILIVVIFATHKKNPPSNETDSKATLSNTSWKPNSPDDIVQNVSATVEPQPVPQETAGGVVSTEVLDPVPAKIEDVQPVHTT
jgi:cell division protein FtsN